MSVAWLVAVVLPPGWMVAVVLPPGWMVAVVLPPGWPPTALLVITGPRSPSRCIRSDAGEPPLLLPSYHLPTIRG